MKNQNKRDYKSNSQDLDSDIIALKLWKGERNPQNEWERNLKDEFEGIKRQGKVPDISF